MIKEWLTACARYYKVGRLYEGQIRAYRDGRLVWFDCTNIKRRHKDDALSDAIEMIKSNYPHLKHNRKQHRYYATW